MTDIWQLEIIQPSGNVFVICGSEDVLRQAYDEWRDAVKQPDGVAPVVLEVVGFCNSADRAEHTIAVRLEDIWGLALTKLY